MITIRELADRLGVSPTTVSNVVNGRYEKVSEKTRQRIEAAIEETRFVQNMSLRVLSKNTSHIIGVVVYPHTEHEDTFLTDPFYGRFLGSVEKKLHDYHYVMMVYCSNDLDDIYRMVAGWNVDGVLAVNFYGAEYQELSDRIQKPVVAVDIQNREQVRYNVGIDDFHATYEMTRLLCSYGYRDIQPLFKADTGADHDRFLGCCQAVADCGLAPLSAPFLLLSDVRDERIPQYEMMFRRKTDRTAWFFFADIYAVEAMHHFANQGIRIPQELGVVGFDNNRIASLSVPPLTTVGQSIDRKAKTALQMLLRLIRGERVEPGIVDLETWPVLRGSIQNFQEDQPGEPR